MQEYFFQKLNILRRIDKLLKKNESIKFSMVNTNLKDCEKKIQNFLEAIQINFHQWVNGETCGIYIQHIMLHNNRLLLSLNKKGNSDRGYNLDQP